MMLKQFAAKIPAGSEVNSDVAAQRQPQKDNDQRFDLLDHPQDLHHVSRANENKDLRVNGATCLWQFKRLGCPWKLVIGKLVG